MKSIDYLERLNLEVLLHRYYSAFVHWLSHGCKTIWAVNGSGLLKKSNNGSMFGSRKERTYFLEMEFENF